MLEKLCKDMELAPFTAAYGRVKKLRRDAVRVFVPNVKVGSLLAAHTLAGNIPMEVVSLDPQGHVAMPLDDLGDVR